MKSFPTLSALLLLLTLGISLWLQAEPATPASTKSTVVVQGIAYEFTQNPDGSDTISLRNRPFCMAAVRTNAEGESEIRCLSTPAALETFLAEEPQENNASAITDR